MGNAYNSDELQHHGTKGMKWGRRLYQNKDGSLTPLGQKRYNKEVEKLKKETAKVKAAEQVEANRKKTQTKIDKLEAKKQALEERKKALKEEKYGKKKKGESDEYADETPEQRKERLLKSNDPKELYKYKDELSTFELNERINRIDTENRLQSKIVEEHKTTGLEYMDKAKNVIDKSTNLFRSVDNAYSAVTNSAIGKTLAKQLGIEPPKKEFNLAETWKNRNKLSTQEMMDLNKRLTAEDQIELKLNARTKAKQEAADAKARAEKEAEGKKAVDEYNKRWQNGEFNKESTYSKSGDDIIDSKVAAGKPKTDRLRIEQIDHVDPKTVTVEGKGTSSYNPNKKETVIDAEEGKDYWDVNTNVKNTSYNNATNSETYSIGQNYIAGYLEDKRGE